MRKCIVKTKKRNFTLYSKFYVFLKKDALVAYQLGNPVVSTQKDSNRSEGLFY